MTIKTTTTDNTSVFLEQLENNSNIFLRNLLKERRSMLKLIRPLTYLLFLSSAVFFVFGIVSLTTDINSILTIILQFALSLTSLIAAVSFGSYRTQEEDKFKKIEEELVKIERTEAELKYLETIEDSEEKKKLLDEIIERQNKREIAKI